MQDNEPEPLTLGFMQVGLDIVTSANYKSQLQFQQTNNYQLLCLTSTKFFLISTLKVHDRQII